MNTPEDAPRRGSAAEPEDLARLLVERVNAGDLDGVVALYEPEGVLALPGEGVAAGHDAIRRFYADLLAGAPRFEPGDQLPALRLGDLALTSTRLVGGVRASRGGLAEEQTGGMEEARGKGKPGRKLAGYPEEWPLVAWLVKSLVDWRCEHCGAYRPPGAGDNLTVHHLDGRPDNLQSRNLVPLCFPCHGLVARLVQDLDIEQLSLLGEPLFPGWPNGCGSELSTPGDRRPGCGYGGQSRRRCLHPLRAGLCLWLRTASPGGVARTNASLRVEGL